MKKFFYAAFAALIVFFAMSSCTPEANDAAFGGAMELSPAIEKMATPPPAAGVDCNCHGGDPVECAENTQGEFDSAVVTIANGDPNYAGDHITPNVGWYAYNKQLLLVNNCRDTFPVRFFHNWKTNEDGIYINGQFLTLVTDCCPETGGLRLTICGKTFILAFAGLWGEAKIIEGVAPGYHELVVAATGSANYWWNAALRLGLYNGGPAKNYRFRIRLADGSVQGIRFYAEAGTPTTKFGVLPDWATKWGGWFRVTPNGPQRPLIVTWKGRRYFLPNTQPDGSCFTQGDWWGDCTLERY